MGQLPKFNTENEDPNEILDCSTFRFKNVDMFLPDKIIETAKLFIFCGNISPSNENRTGPIPKP